MSADIRQAFDNASGAKTPWNPSRRAIARVTNPLPAPTACPYCDGKVELVRNDRIYRHAYGEWPWAYLCTTPGCGAYVGLHPYTAIPLGTLANAELRERRKAAKDIFNPMWQGDGANMSRSEAYAWLAKQMGLDTGECHIGWFDVMTCDRVIAVCGGALGRAIPAEVQALIARVRAMDEECDLVLSRRQQDWLDDILIAAENGELRMAPNTMKFLQSCGDGFYSAGGVTC